MSVSIHLQHLKWYWRVFCLGRGNMTHLHPKIVMVNHLDSTNKNTYSILGILQMPHEASIISHSHLAKIESHICISGARLGFSRAISFVFAVTEPGRNGCKKDLKHPESETRKRRATGCEPEAVMKDRCGPQMWSQRQ